jgi:hypothetical protein
MNIIAGDYNRSIRKPLMASKAWSIAIGATFFLFFIVNYIGTPLLNSGDDFFQMYVLAGGYGDPPSNLLHYNWGWHYWLGALVKGLFEIFPGINWHTILLVLLHLAGCIVIFYVFLRKFVFKYAILLFGLFFFFIEIRFLLSLSFTNTAIVAACGGLTLLIQQYQEEKIYISNIVASILLILLAGLLRQHVLWMTAFVFMAPSILLLKRRRAIQYAAIVTILIIILFFANILHKNYYRNHIPGWDRHEKLREAVFIMFNRAPNKTIQWQQVFKDSTEKELFDHGLYYDTTLFPINRTKEIAIKLVRQRWMDESEDWQALKWSFIESRIYVALLFPLLLLFWLQSRRRHFFKTLLLLLPVLCIYGYLFIFLKLNFSLFIGLWMMSFLSVALLLEQEFFSHLSRNVRLFFMLMILLLSGWMMLRHYKFNAVNIANYKKFSTYFTELKQHKDKLFISTDYDFPGDYFYIWDTPQQWPLANYLYSVWWQADSYPNIYKRFGIKDLKKEIGIHPAIYLLGKDKRAIELYFPGVEIGDSLQEFKNFKVYQLKK